MRRDYLGCPHCGQSDPDDNRIIDTDPIYYEGQELHVIETRLCDICAKTYCVEVVYKPSFEIYYDE